MQLIRTVSTFWGPVCTSVPGAVPGGLRDRDTMCPRMPRGGCRRGGPELDKAIVSVVLRLAGPRFVHFVPGRACTSTSCARLRRRTTLLARDPLFQDAVARVQDGLDRGTRKVLLALARGGAQQAVVLSGGLAVDAGHHDPAVERPHGLHPDDLQADASPALGVPGRSEGRDHRGLRGGAQDTLLCLQTRGIPLEHLPMPLEAHGHTPEAVRGRDLLEAV